ncbi:MAG TPA: hypothetical protein VG498_24845, partial [Terriglobales bacterium]|nr:hypothetical protein [Terriglobales bacterium]
SKVSGNHTLKFGALYSRNAKDEEVGAEGGEFWTGGDANGPAVDYNGPGWTNSPFGTGNYYADYLLKGMTFGYDEAQRDNFALVRWRDMEFYGGDTWKIKPRLTLNYGLRWSLVKNPYLDDNQLAGFLPSLYNPAMGNDPCNGMILAEGAPNTCPAIGSKVTPPHFHNRTLIEDNNHAFQPRIGFAWDVFGTQRFVFRGGVGQFYSRDRLLAISMRSNNPPFGVSTGGVRSLDGPIVGYPNSASGVNCVTQGCVFGAALGGTPHQGLDPSPNQANSWQWNLMTEAALWKDAKLEMGWVANRGIHLQNAWDANQVPASDRLKAAQSSVTGGQSQTSYRPYPFNNQGQLTMWSHSGDSIYHSLQSMFTARLPRGSMVQAAYTWSKNLASTTFGYVGTNTVFADNTNSRANRGPADFDRRHVFAATLIYNTPALADWHPAARGVLAGWETTAVVDYASGPSLTVGGTTNLGGDVSGVATSGLFTSRPLRVKGQPCHLDNAPTGTWLNPAAFTFNGYQLGTFGNSGPGQCAGPPISDVDFALNKSWGVPFLKGRYLGENPKLQFRLDFFNIFNHPNFRFNGQNLTYKVLGATAVDASGKNCSSAPSSCIAVSGGTLDQTTHFGQPQFTTASGNREMQYGLKLIF